MIAVQQTLLRIFLVFLIFTSIPAQAETSLKVGVAPDGSGSVALAKLWIPFLKQLEASSDIRFRFATAPDLLTFHQRLGNHEYDLAVTDSYLYTIFQQKHSLQFIAELGPLDKANELVLVCHSDIERIEQLDGALLAVRRGEANSNLKLLDEFLTDKGVTLMRDGVSSNEKVLSSIEQKVHLAGLVPLELAQQQGRSLNILWRAQNQHHYVMSTSPSLNKVTQKLLSKLLDVQLTQPPTPAEIAVLSVRKTEE